MHYYGKGKFRISNTDSARIKPKIGYSVAKRSKKKKKEDHQTIYKYLLIIHNVYNYTQANIHTHKFQYTARLRTIDLEGYTPNYC